LRGWWGGGMPGAGSAGYTPLSREKGRGPSQLRTLQVRTSTMLIDSTWMIELIGVIGLIGLTGAVGTGEAALTDYP